MSFTTASTSSSTGSSSSGSGDGSDLASILSDYSTHSGSTHDFTSYTAPESSNPELHSFLNHTTTTSSSQATAVYTQEEVETLFLEQKRAAEWVKGNYTIIQQITANKNMANTLIQKITTQYQLDKQQQEGVYAQLEKVSLNKSKIESAISNLNTKMSNINQNIITVEGHQENLYTSREEVIHTQRETENNIAGLEQELLKVKGDITMKNGSLGDSQLRCRRLTSSLT